MTRTEVIPCTVELVEDHIFVVTPEGDVVLGPGDRAEVTVNGRVLEQPLTCYGRVLPRPVMGYEGRVTIRRAGWLRRQVTRLAAVVK